jgi:hypothetical protein
MVLGSDVELIFFLLRSKVGIGFDTLVFSGEEVGGSNSCEFNNKQTQSTFQAARVFFLSKILFRQKEKILILND